MLTLQAVDILIVGINTSESTVDVSLLDDQCNDNGTLSTGSISTNTDHLSSNVTFSFPCNSETECDVSFKCVWYNE